MASANLFTNCESVEEVHNTLMTSFCCDFLDVESQKNKFQRFKLRSFLYLTNPVERCVSNPHDIWEELEKKGLLGLDNYKVLKKLVNEIDDDLTFTIEDAEEKIKLLKGEGVTARKRQRTVKDEDTEVKDFWKLLCKENYFEAQKCRVTPLQPTSKLPVEDIFAPVCIREDLEYKAKGRYIGLKNKRTKPVNCPDDMFFIEGDIARNVFILGDAGIGKSVFCLRLVENWCKAQKLNVGDTRQKDRDDNSMPWVYALKNFDFLFFVQLRHVDKSRSSVIDMIVNDVFYTHPSCHDVIRRVLLSESYRCLLVVDGIDEWKISDEVRSELKIDSLPNTENIVNCTFLWSMRPWIMGKLSDIIRSNDRVVEIQGLDEDSKDILIEKMLVNFYELDENSSLYQKKKEAIKEKAQKQNIKAIMKIPLMAVACMQIWYEEKEVGNSMTSLYVALLDLLIKLSNKKAPLPDEISEKLGNKSTTYTEFPQPILENKNIKKFLSVIMKLGRIAYDDLVSEETYLVFRVEDLEYYLEEYELDIALKIGLLSKCEAPCSCNEENVSINFFHKSMQEFLAALYINGHDEIQSFYSHLSSVDVFMELGNVLMFLSGLNSMLGSGISKLIVEIANVDTEIVNYRKFKDALLRNDKVKSLYKIQVDCYREITYAHSKAKFSPQISYHVLDVHVENDNSMDTILTTADFLTHHNADIRSLFLEYVPSCVVNGIPDSLLTFYLDNCVSLQLLYINGFNTNRTLHHISSVFSSLSALLLYSITLSPEAISTLQSALQSNTVIQTLGLIGIGCQINEDQGHIETSLSCIIQTLPDLPCLSSLHIQVTNEDDKCALRDVLCRLSNLHSIEYNGTDPDDDENDRDVVQTMCTWSGLRWLLLEFVDLGHTGLQLSNHMSHLEQAILWEVKMTPSGWRVFIQNALSIKHKYDVQLEYVNIDEESRSIIRSSTELEITFENENNDGSYDFDFTRV